MVEVLAGSGMVTVVDELGFVVPATSGVDQRRSATLNATMIIAFCRRSMMRPFVGHSRRA